MQTTHPVSHVLGTIQIAVLVLVGLVYVYARIIRKRKSAELSDGPLLASEGLLSSPGLTALNKGKMAGLDYTIMTNDAGSVMIMVELGHDSDMHLLAYGDKSRVSPLVKASISRKWLEAASLEGDFPDYFHLYVSPDKQVAVRQVFTPDVVAQFADFCRAYDFEIFADCLYIAQSNGAHDKNDETTLATDVENFLTKNTETLHRL